jgi:hypothetical protein
MLAPRTYAEPRASASIAASASGVPQWNRDCRELLYPTTAAIMAVPARGDRADLRQMVLVACADALRRSREHR